MIIVTTTPASLPPVSRPVTFVACTTSDSTSITLPTHQAGDVIIVTAFFRTANDVIPTAPTGSGSTPAWLALSNFGFAGGQSFGYPITSRAVYFTATQSAHTSGTWTNANTLMAAVLRPTAGATVTVSTVHKYYGATSATTATSYPAYGLTSSDVYGTSNAKTVSMMCTLNSVTVAAASGWTRCTKSTYSDVEYASSGVLAGTLNMAAKSFSSASAALGAFHEVWCSSPA